MCSLIIRFVTRPTQQIRLEREQHPNHPQSIVAQSTTHSHARHGHTHSPAAGAINLMALESFHWLNTILSIMPWQLIKRIYVGGGQFSTFCLFVETVHGYYHTETIIIIPDRGERDTLSLLHGEWGAQNVSHLLLTSTLTHRVQLINWWILTNWQWTHWCCLLEWFVEYPKSLRVSFYSNVNLTGVATLFYYALFVITAHFLFSINFIILHFILPTS